VRLFATNGWILTRIGIKIPDEFAPAMGSPWFWTGASRPRNPCCGIPAFVWKFLQKKAATFRILG